MWIHGIYNHSWSSAPLKEEYSKNERYFSTQTSDVTCDYRLREKYTVANNEKSSTYNKLIIFGHLCAHL